MNPNNISPDDPRLTAYALDEMEPAELAEFARLIQDDAVARAAVEEIRAMAQTLDAALRDEPAPATTPSRHDNYQPATAAPRAKVLRFPQLYFVISGLAAACFAMFFVVHEADRTTREETLAKKAMVFADARDKDAMGGVSANQMDRAAPAAARMARMAPSGFVALVPAEFAVEDRFFPTADSAISTFPLRMGHESYEAVRAQLRAGLRPARETVHVAEMINTFAYAWPAPGEGEAFASVLEEVEAPWAPGHRLVRVGLKAEAGGGRPLARDARVEVEFNPARVLAWRLVGFEREGGAAGVRGSSGETLLPGDAVTVLYELVPATDALPGADQNLLRLALHYREAASGEPRVFERTLPAGEAGFAQASADMKFMAAVAAFGLHLRDPAARGAVGLAEIEQWARSGGDNAERKEFLGLVQAAGRIVR